MAAITKMEARISVECTDHAEGFPFVIVYDDKTVLVPAQQITIQWTASYDGQGLYSSVQPFQNAHLETDGSPMDTDPPETDDNLPASSVRPFQSLYWDNEDSGMEVESSHTIGSVTPFQSLNWEDKDSDMEGESPDTVRDVAPPGSFTEDEIPMEVQG